MHGNLSAQMNSAQRSNSFGRCLAYSRYASRHLSGSWQPGGGSAGGLLRSNKAAILSHPIGLGRPPHETDRSLSNVVASRRGPSIVRLGSRRPGSRHAASPACYGRSAGIAINRGIAPCRHRHLVWPSRWVGWHRSGRVPRPIGHRVGGRSRSFSDHRPLISVRCLVTGHSVVRSGGLIDPAEWGSRWAATPRLAGCNAG